MEVQHLFEKLCFDPRQETTEELVRSDRLRIVRICSSGQAGTLYDQDEHEWVTLLQGEAKILFLDENETVSLQQEDHLLIEAGRRHCVSYSSDRCLWLCVFWRD